MRHFDTNENKYRQLGVRVYNLPILQEKSTQFYSFANALNCAAIFDMGLQQATCCAVHADCNNTVLCIHTGFCIDITICHIDALRL